MAEMDKIWWNQITRANRLLHGISETMLAGKSVILSLPPSVPWYQTMYSQVEEYLHQGNPNNSLLSFPCPQGDVGEYLFESYCKREKRATFRRGTSYAAFLAKSEDLVLNNRYLWVRDVSGGKLEEWGCFLAKYNSNLPQGMPPAVFLFEVAEGAAARKAVKGVQNFCFSNEIDAYDCFAFCALASTEEGISLALRPYLAELVSTLCRDDLELCAVCIQQNRTFLENPQMVLQDIHQKKLRSDGRPFDTSSVLDNLRERLWESQLKLLFPALQRYLVGFIQAYKEEIQAALPFTTSYGAEINDPRDVELGLLVYLADAKQLVLDSAAYQQLTLFRDARNSLAHMKPIDFSAVEKILTARF